MGEGGLHPDEVGGEVLLVAVAEDGHHHRSAIGGVWRRRGRRAAGNCPTLPTNPKGRAFPDAAS